MKKIILTIFIVILITSCNFPKLQKQDDKTYKIINWDGGDFYYVTYHWEGGKFDDAINIIEEFIKITEERNQNEIAIGRFPTGKEWQLGFIAATPFKDSELMGKIIDNIKIQGGTYASLLAKGHPEKIFIFWKKLKKWLEKDNYVVESPVFEIYIDTFNQGKNIKNRIGEIRYKISQ
jgi:effector-binding domain-containing protein